MRPSIKAWATGIEHATKQLASSTQMQTRTCTKSSVFTTGPLDTLMSEAVRYAGAEVRMATCAIWDRPTFIKAKRSALSKLVVSGVHGQAKTT